MTNFSIILLWVNDLFLWQCNDIVIFLNLLLQIGQYISSNGGVVTAEELAPYLDLETADRNLVCSCLM